MSQSKEHELIQATLAKDIQEDELLLILLAITRLKTPTHRAVRRLIELGAHAPGRARALAQRVLCDDVCPKLHEPPTDLLRTHLRAHDERERIMALEALLACAKHFGPSMPIHQLAHGQSAHPNAQIRALVLDILHLTSAAFPYANPNFEQWLQHEPDPSCQKRLLVALANAAAQRRTDPQQAKDLIHTFLTAPQREVSDTARWALELLRISA